MTVADAADVPTTTYRAAEPVAPPVDVEALRETLETATPAIRACVAPDAEGETLRVDAAVDGTLASVTYFSLSGELADATDEACVADALGALALPSFPAQVLVRWEVARE